MKGFLLGMLSLTFSVALLEGQASGQGGNVTGLLAFPGVVVKKFLDPGEPFFRARATEGG